MNITAIILAKNEEKVIKKAIQSVSFCDEVLVIDDESTDATVQIAQNSGATVISHALNKDFAKQRNWAMEQVKNEWILFVDADEEISADLKLKICNVKLQGDVIAYAIPRRDFFWEHEMKYGETKQARTKGIIRLVKKGGGTWTGAVHETFTPVGVVDRVDAFLDHYSHDSLSSFIHDINIYSTIRAKELAALGKQVSILELIFYPFGKFMYTYFLLGGFLDGPAGFTYSFLMSFHSFLVRAKLLTKSYV